MCRASNCPPAGLWPLSSLGLAVQIQVGGLQSVPSGGAWCRGKARPPRLQPGTHSMNFLDLFIFVSQPLYNVFFNLFCNVLFLSIAAILVILPTVFIADLFCESCTLMFCLMSKSKVFKEILVLFNVAVEPAGNTEPAAIVWQAGPRGQVHFVTYAINSRLYVFGICGFAVEMRFQFLDGATRKEVSGGRHRPGPCKEMDGRRDRTAGETEASRPPTNGPHSANTGLRAFPTCWLLLHTLAAAIGLGFYFSF